MRAPGTYSRSLARPHAPPRALESLTDTRTLNHRSGWAAFTCNGHAISRNLPVGRTTMDARGARIVDHTRHVATAQDRTGHGVPGHEATLPIAADGFATRGTLPFRVRDACRASTSCTHTIAQAHAMRPSRPGHPHAASRSFRELRGARQAGLTVSATLRQLSATRAHVRRSASGWMEVARRRSPCAPGSRQESWPCRTSIDLRR